MKGGKNMLYIYTDTKYIPKKVELVLDIEYTYSEVLRDEGRNAFSDDVCNHVIESIDGLEWRQELMVCTRWGATAINNLSTGCKGALLAVKYPNLVISTSELGNNVFDVLIRLSKEHDIHLYANCIIVARYELGIDVMYNGRKKKIEWVIDKLFDKFYPLPLEE